MSSSRFFSSLFRHPIVTLTSLFWTSVDVFVLFFRTLINPAAISEINTTSSTNTRASGMRSAGHRLG
jgi:hypothetical protein